METEEFEKLYHARLEEMKKYFEEQNLCYDDEAENYYCYEESKDMLKLLDLKSKELSNFLNDETIETWSETFEGVEKKIKRNDKNL